MSDPNFVPYIPDSAPFTPAQRAWLNGFFAGIFSQAPGGAMAAPPAQAAAPVNVSVLYATQSGTAEGLAKKIGKELKGKGHEVKALSLDSYTATALAEEKVALVVASTYGDGDPPDGVKAFYDHISDPAFPRLDHLNFAVLALGDSHYEHFCKFGKDLEARLIELGAKPMLDRVDCDVDLDEPFAQWKASVAERLAKVSLNGNGNGAGNGNGSHAAPAKAAAAPAKATGPTRDNPFHAPLIDKRDLTHSVSSKQVVHLAFSLANSGVEYEAGDALGVIPTNDPQLVDEVLAATKLTGEETVTLDKGKVLPIREALLTQLLVTQLSRKLVQAYATKGECHPLLGLLPPEQQTHFDSYMHGRGLIDLLCEYPGVIATAADLAAILPKLPPRLYSISSSPRAHIDQVHTTVAVVRYRTHDRQRGGVCSTMFADRMSVGDTAPVYIQVNKKFRLPTDSDAPIIMIGPGTGIAPFRSFLHDRLATGAKGKNWLFFGERTAASDFLYREELEQMVVDQFLTRLDLAFSRDQQEKIYVQDRMAQQGALFWSWLQEGASIYVCGDATYMAKDVDKTLHKIIEQHGGFSEDAAAEFVSDLKDHHRYHRDVY
jgi:sulfite reductase (NADPH) flavoprotein alpha-component